MGRKLTQEEFVERANQIHNGKYDYSETNYTTSHDLIVIGCPVHGKFTQKAYQHLAGGCRKCGRKICADKFRMPLTQWIEECHGVHEYKYDYSAVQYSNINEKVRIGCPIHGMFEQVAMSHRLGTGCSKCGRVKCSEKIRRTSVKFIEKAREIHGEKYDYSRAEYTNSITSITIGCPIHGDFFQTPTRHLTTGGCKKCKHEALRTSYTLGLDDFISRSSAIHCGRYQYPTDQIYINRKSKIRIICPSHGEFSQIVGDHLGGSGCPTCKSVKACLRAEYILNDAPLEDKLEKGRFYITLWELDGRNRIKIGKTTRRIAERDIGRTFPVFVLLDYECTVFEAYYIERFLLSKYENRRGGFNLKYLGSGYTETFPDTLRDEIIGDFEIAKIESQLVLESLKNQNSSG